MYQVKNMNEKEFMIARRILKLGSLLMNLRNSDVMKYGLTSSQSETLLFISSRETTNIRDLKEHFQVTHQAACRIVSRMKNNGLLDMEVSEEDRRERVLKLTPEAEEICRVLKRSGGGYGQLLLNGFSDERQDELYKMIEDMIGNLEGRN